MSSSEDYVVASHDDVDDVDDVDSVTKTSKQKRKTTKPRSVVWDHFTRYTENREGRCKCNYCGFSYKCNPRINGTSTYKTHLSKCARNPHNKKKDAGPKQTQLSFQSSVNKDGEEGTLKNWIFNYDRCRKALAFMIIVDELPFRFVEGQGFRYFCSELSNKFHVPSRWTVARDCYELFIDERLKLKTFLKANCKRVCITTDTWTSLQKINYMCVTAHFIDNDWKLNKQRILNFCPISSHKGESIGKAIEKCLLAWGIDKIMTITVDNASSNDTAILYLKRKINNWGTSVLKGDFLHVRCVAHIMNLVVNDGLKMVNDSVHRVRNAIRFVKSSCSRVEKFKKCVVEEKIYSQSMLSLDVPTRWNSTYLILDTALKFENAFERFDTEDSHYHADLLDEGGYGKGLGKPISEDWDHVRNLIRLLEAFYHLTLRVSGSLYVTSNTYFHEITDVDCLLKEWCDSSNVDFKIMARKMKEKCDKYWGDPQKLNAMMFMSTVHDPRCKWEVVELGICQMYENSIAMAVCDRVKKALKDMYDEYKGSQVESNSAVTSSGIDGETNTQSKGIIRARYKKLKATKDDGEGKTELDKYLNEATEEDVDDFDILLWWKVNSGRYPTLSLIARDVLAIPVSTVASESAFSTGGRVLDPFRSSLSPKIVEALICTQDWLRASPNGAEEIMEDIEKLDRELSKISLAPAVIDIA